MKYHRLLTIQYAVFIFLICCQPVIVKKNFAAANSGTDTVSVLFPEIDYSEKDSKLEKSKTGYNVFISRNIAEVLKDLIDKGNFMFRHANILYDPSMSSQSLPGYYENSIIKFNRIHDSLETFKEEKRVFPINPTLRKLLNAAHSHYFLYVTGLAFGTSEATRQYYLAQQQLFEQLYFNTLVNNYQFYGLQLQIVLVDTRTGKILWYNYNGENDCKYNPLEKSDIERLCLKLLKAD
jgi:hypothetical protein